MNTIFLRLSAAAISAVFLSVIAFAQDAELPVAPLPTPEELEALDVRIGEITIESQNIFDLDDPEENRLLYRWANKLHVVTRPQVIRSQLLIAEGDEYSERLIEESERLLRQNVYLREADIETVSLEDGLVDLRVSTADVWSLTPSITAGREGGQNRLGLGVRERNLFGRGMLLSFKYKSTVDRDTAIFDFADRHFRGTRNNFAVRIGENSDGYDRQLYFAKPFFALDSRRSNGVSIAAVDLTEPLYDRGEIISEFQHTYQHHEVFAGWSAGLRDGWVRRYFAGAVYDDHEFSAVPETIDPIALVPGNRKYVYPYLGFETVQDHFEESENFDRIGIVEDRFLGTRFAFRVGYAPEAFGSSADSWHYRASFSNALVASKQTSLTVGTGIEGRHEDHMAKNLVFSFETRFHRRVTNQQLFYASLSGAIGDNLDLDNQLLIGGDSGLRGYPLRYQGGDMKALLTLEQRFFTDWYPWRLFNVGAAIFFDAGRTWGNNPVGAENLGLLRDAGVGLRLGNNRAGDGGVLHIDFAFPLDGDDSIDNFQVLIDIRSSF